MDSNGGLRPHNPPPIRHCIMYMWKHATRSTKDYDILPHFKRIIEILTLV